MTAREAAEKMREAAAVVCQEVARRFLNTGDSVAYWKARGAIRCAEAMDALPLPADEPTEGETPSTVRECIRAVVKELNLDTTHPLTKLLAIACGLQDAHNEMKQALERRLREQEAKAKVLREALIEADRQACTMRVWGGMEWKYHTPQAKRIHDACEKALAAKEAGRG